MIFDFLVPDPCPFDLAEALPGTTEAPPASLNGLAGEAWPSTGKGPNGRGQGSVPHLALITVSCRDGLPVPLPVQPVDRAS